MISPVINLFRTKEEAFYFKNSQINNFYLFGGIHLLPNNPTSYVQVTNTPNGINLEDWTVYAKSLCGTKSVDITESFMVDGLTNSDNGNPQIIWSLTNVNVDFDSDLVYLEISQAVGETFYSQPFLLTEYDSEKNTQFHYKFKRTDEYQSIGFKAWFRQDDEKEELTTYYESSTSNTVTTAIKINEIDIYQTELMATNELKHLKRVLRSPYLYAGLIRCSLFEAVEFPKMKSQENFGKFEFSLSFNKNDIYKQITKEPDYNSSDYDNDDYFTNLI